jgi:SAM-dependent methyltransferase
MTAKDQLWSIAAVSENLEMERALYDRIGLSYSATRRTDDRLAIAIWEALGEARTVVNVGAGSGAYEPPDRDVTAVEPSSVMMAQRPPTVAPAVQAQAEALPFADGSFDAAMAVLSDHHWPDRRQGLQELRRVARQRVVLFNADPALAERFWLTTDYLPGFLDLIPARYRTPGAWQRELHDALGPVRLMAAPIPHDCTDGFYGAFWRRPSAYLDAHVRAGISVFAKLAADEVDRAVEALDADLRSNAWQARHRDLLALSELHLGYYVVIAELS